MFFIGLIVFIIGILFVVFAQNIWNFTGGIDFIENHFPGNTRAFIQLLGVIMVIVGLLMVTGIGSWLVAPIANTLGGVLGGPSGNGI